MNEILASLKKLSQLKRRLINLWMKIKKVSAKADETAKNPELTQKIDSIKNRLIEKGKKNGFITYKEVLRSLKG